MADRDSRQDVDWGWGGGGGGGKGWGMEGDKFIADRKTGSWFGGRQTYKKFKGCRQIGLDINLVARDRKFLDCRQRGS